MGVIYGVDRCDQIRSADRNRCRQQDRPIDKNMGGVRAEARVVTQGRQIISTEAKVMSANGMVLAHGTSTIMVLGGAK